MSKVDEKWECGICCGKDGEDGCKKVFTKCTHSYCCENCLEKWMDTNPVCPVCRTKLKDEEKFNYVHRPLILTDEAQLLILLGLLDSGDELDVLDLEHLCDSKESDDESDLPDLELLCDSEESDNESDLPDLELLCDSEESDNEEEIELNSNQQVGEFNHTTDRKKSPTCISDKGLPEDFSEIPYVGLIPWFTTNSHESLDEFDEKIKNIEDMITREERKKKNQKIALSDVLNNTNNKKYKSKKKYIDKSIKRSNNKFRKNNKFKKSFK